MTVEYFVCVHLLCLSRPHSTRVFVLLIAVQQSGADPHIPANPIGPGPIPAELPANHPRVRDHSIRQQAGRHATGDPAHRPAVGPGEAPELPTVPDAPPSNAAVRAGEHQPLRGSAAERPRGVQPPPDHGVRARVFEEMRADHPAIRGGVCDAHRIRRENRRDAQVYGEPAGRPAHRCDFAGHHRHAAAGGAHVHRAHFAAATVSPGVVPERRCRYFTG